MQKIGKCPQYRSKRTAKLRKEFLSFILLVLCASFVFTSFGYGQDARERITNFSSELVINEDASLVVTETIEVVAQGRQIRRGIYRDFPTT